VRHEPAGLKPFRDVAQQCRCLGRVRVQSLASAAKGLEHPEVGDRATNDCLRRDRGPRRFWHSRAGHVTEVASSRFAEEPADQVRLRTQPFGDLASVPEHDGEVRMILSQRMETIVHGRIPDLGADRDDQTVGAERSAAPTVAKHGRLEVRGAESLPVLGLVDGGQPACEEPNNVQPVLSLSRPTVSAYVVRAIELASDRCHEPFELLPAHLVGVEQRG